MRLGYTVGIVFGCLLVGLVAVTFVLPTSVSSTGEADVCAAPAEAFEAFNDLERVGEWSSLFRSVSADEKMIAGPRGEQATLRVEDSRERWLQLTITESEADARLRYRLTSHEGFNAGVAVAVDAAGAGSRLQLTIDKSFDSLWSRWAIIFIHGALEELIEEELGHVREHLRDTAPGCEVVDSPA